MKPFASITTSLFPGFANDEAGVTAIEYALIASLIAVVVITAVELVGTNLSAKLDAVVAAH
jgi:pilus assembly protein Flp/PilA